MDGRANNLTNGAEPQNGSAFAHPGERVDDLRRGGLMILQRPDRFRFGTDSVLLAHFAAPRKGDRVADLGTGSGVLCLLMSARQPQAVFDGVEVQADMADMARRSVAMNHLEARIRIHHMDMRRAAAELGYGGYTLVVCNPPYSQPGRAIASAQAAVSLARHQGELALEEIALSGAQLLKNGGRMALVYPAAGLLDLMWALRAARLEPKRIQLVQDRPGAQPKLALLDAVKGGGSQLHWLPPLVLREADGSWSGQWREIYGEEA